MRTGPIHRWLLVASAAAILAVTLVPLGGEEPEVWLACLVCGERGFADALVNVLLFLPFGAALAATGVRASRCVLIGALLSTGVEFAQLFIGGRDPSLGDIASNTLGSAVGAGLVATAPSWLLPAPAQATWLSRGAALTAVVICFSTGWLLAPAPPPTRYFARWTPRLAHLQPYRGRVLDAMINDIPLPPGPLDNSVPIHEALRSPRGFSLRVRAIAGPDPTGLSALFAVFDQHRREIILLGPDRDDLVFRLRLRAAAWRLDQPDIRLAGMLRAVAPGDALDLTVRGQDRRYAVTVNSTLAELGLTLGAGWGLLMYPESLPVWFMKLLSLAWIAALWFPAGFWARTRMDTWASAAALALGLLGAPAVTALAVTPPLQWAAAALGAIVGASAARTFERRYRRSMMAATGA